MYPRYLTRIWSSQNLFRKIGKNIELCLDANSDVAKGKKLTIALVGPSRKGKSVTAGLLVKDHTAFTYSHSPRKPQTSGTQIYTSKENGSDFQVVDSEGISHTLGPAGTIGAKKLLSATYLTSSWLVWVDSNVMEDSFFGSMELVKNYVASEVPEERMPSLLYLRTSDNETARLGYRPHQSFQDYFAHEVTENERLNSLTPMFKQMKGIAFPEFTIKDLDAYQSGSFWSDEYVSPFKDQLKAVKDQLLAESSPPPLSFQELRPLLRKINALDAVDFHVHVKQEFDNLIATEFKRFKFDTSNIAFA